MGRKPRPLYSISIVNHRSQPLEMAEKGEKHIVFTERHNLANLKEQAGHLWVPPSPPQSLPAQTHHVRQEGSGSRKTTCRLCVHRVCRSVGRRADLASEAQTAVSQCGRGYEQKRTGCCFFRTGTDLCILEPLL